MTGKYDDLSKTQLIELLEKRDRTKKLGLVWERDEIAADAAIDENFVACEVVAGLSDKAAPRGNMVIERDNFDALRWLRMTHAGRVKCIYIDPPYNTGNKDWVYNDDYVDREGLCCANAMKDSLCESSVVACLYEQTEAPDLPHHELA